MLEPGRGRERERARIRVENVGVLFIGSEWRRAVIST